MAHRTKQDRLVWLSISTALHTALIIGAFISFIAQPLFVPQKNTTSAQQEPLPVQQKENTPHPQKETPQETFRVPAPVIFYGQELDPHKKPGAPQPPAPLVQTQEHAPLPHTQKPLEPLSATTFFETTNSKSQVPERDKKPTLTDIFNHARSTFSSPHNTDIEEGEGSGQPVVIREGDMKYYSLWATFLKHLNDTARFNRVRKPVPLDEWIRTKKITQNLQCSIMINKAGKVLKIDLITSSGCEPFDQLCMQDIWAASPFPPLPDQLKKETACFEVKSHF